MSHKKISCRNFKCCVVTWSVALCFGGTCTHRTSRLITGYFTEKTSYFILSVNPSLFNFMSQFAQKLLFLSCCLSALLFPHNQFLQGFFFFFLQRLQQRAITSAVISHRNPTATITLFLCSSFSSSSVLVVRGAGTPPPPPSPEEQAERASRKSAHAAPHELHEAQPLTRVSVHTAALFGLRVRCVCMCVGCVNRQTRPLGESPSSPHEAWCSLWISGQTNCQANCL